MLNIPSKCDVRLELAAEPELVLFSQTRVRNATNAGCQETIRARQKCPAFHLLTGLVA